MSGDPSHHPLLWKYREIARLRSEKASGQGEDPAAALRTLSARFPGALRDLDELPPPVLEAIISELEAGSASPSRRLMWTTIAAFHAEMRGILEAKRWLAGAKHVSSETLERFRAAPGLSDGAQSWAPELAHVARPPRGRLTQLVIGRLARHEGVDEEVIALRLRSHLRGPGTQDPPREGPSTGSGPTER